MAKVDVSVPDIGDFKDVPVIEVLVKPGDEVKVEQSLVTLESDKATLDVPSPIAGKLAEVVAKVGDKVSMGTLIARIETGAEAAAPAPAAKAEAAATKPAPAAKAPPAAPPAPAAKEPPAADEPPPGAAPAAASASPGPAKPDFSGVFAGPAVRRLARELDIDLAAIKGSGENGRITREDVKAAISGGAAPVAAAGGAALPAVPLVDFAKFGPVETVPLSRIKRISGPRCTPRGSTFRTSPTPTKPTSPSSRPSARPSTTRPRRTRRSPTGSRCCRC